MKMLSIDRISSLRPIGHDVGSGKGPAPLPAGVVVAKVKAVAAVEPTPSLINQMSKKSTAGMVYTNTADPVQRPHAPELPPHDWRLKTPESETPESEKVDNRPALPEMLIEHLKSIWAASALAVQTPTRAEVLKSEAASLAQLGVRTAAVGNTPDGSKTPPLPRQGEKASG